MEDPRYGTHGPSEIPVLQGSGVTALLLAGESGLSSDTPVRGPFKTVTDVQIIDFSLEAGKKHVHHVPENLNNCIVYVYSGVGTIAGKQISKGHVTRLDATDKDARGIEFTADDSVC